jgi:hypothetical protein
MVGINRNLELLKICKDDVKLAAEILLKEEKRDLK